ncbi:PQQ-dependent sugar dehydrogenase [Candidatus Woesearchaeota archaeon]|nr:PQQ-dependent sugar dehydrogenase [Candidatus Woesearchaeota archaeon]
MKKIRILLLIIVLSMCILIFIFSVPIIKNKNVKQNQITENIRLPEGFKIWVYASELGTSLNFPGPNRGPRFMEFYKDVLFVSVPSAGKIVALPDNNKDGKADKIISVIDGLNKPHGIAFIDDYMYVAAEDVAFKVKIDERLRADLSTRRDIVGLPIGGHWTRTIRAKDNNVYISTGSSCNVCIEKDEGRASIVKCNDSERCKIYASGLRNAVGFVFHPKTKEIYATENSRDYLGDDLPPDEINIVKEGRHYGWPYCYGNNVPDPDFGSIGCNYREPSFMDLQAHSAPLGLAFNFGNNFPQQYFGKLFVAYHGSWNRKVPTGYKIVAIDVDKKEVEDFATGWLTNGNKVLGRPVDVIFDKEGAMHISDDNAGVIYRIWYEK